MHFNYHYITTTIPSSWQLNVKKLRTNTHITFNKKSIDKYNNLKLKN